MMRLDEGKAHFHNQWQTYPPGEKTQNKQSATEDFREDYNCQRRRRSDVERVHEFFGHLSKVAQLHQTVVE